MRTFGIAALCILWVAPAFAAEEAGTIKTSRGQVQIERGTQKLAAEVGGKVEASDVAEGHHERWDGTGYPFGRKGEEIPLAARIVSIADVYDALICHRPHRPARSPEEAGTAIRAGSGTQFDPRLVAVFTAVEDQFAEIVSQHPDESEPA